MPKRKIENLKNWDKNPRTISKEGFERLKNQIEELGEYKPLLITEDGTVLGGNMRLRAYRELGFRECWVSVVKADTEEQKLKYALSDNDQIGEYHKDDLANIIGNLGEIDLGDYSVNLGKGTSIEDLFPDEVEEDEAPEVEEGEPDSKLGEVYTLGRHRLMCGDSTKIEDVEKLMDGQKADMVFTDPPYGNAESGVYGRGELGHRYIAGDENFNVTEDFINLKISDIVVFFLQWRTFREALQTIDNNSLKLKTIGVWDKKNSGLGSGMMEQWEAILFTGNIKFSKFGGNVFTISRETGKRENSPHPHQKPIKLLSEILNYLDGYKTVLDPFGGSGSTLIACEQTNRTCYMMELDPKYCDVIRKRYENYKNSKT